MTHLWWFWNIYKSILLWLVFCWVWFNNSSRIFSFQFMQKVAFFLWHHILNQHIHIDNVYPSGITHFNTMLVIIVWNLQTLYLLIPPRMSFHIFASMPVLAWYTNFKKSQIPIPNGYVKNPIPIQHCYIIIHRPKIYLYISIYPFKD